MSKDGWIGSEQPEKNIVPAPLPSVPEMHGSSPKWSDALAILSPFTEQAPVVSLRSIRQLRGQSVHSGILFSFKKPLLLRSGQVCRKSLIFEVLLLYHSALATIASYR